MRDNSDSAYLERKSEKFVTFFKRDHDDEKMHFNFFLLTNAAPKSAPDCILLYSDSKQKLRVAIMVQGLCLQHNIKSSAKKCTQFFYNSYQLHVVAKVLFFNVQIFMHYNTTKNEGPTQKCNDKDTFYVSIICT